MSQDLERNKETVIKFYHTAFRDLDPEKAFQYLGDYYTQHNPNCPDGKEGFIAFARQRIGDNPGRAYEIKRVIAENDLVVLHSYHWFTPTDKDYVGVPDGRVVADIFRLEKGKIVEHWDVLQGIPEKLAHGNTMY